ncbi:MAG: DUF427 domain-containing protein [Gammaproteobacteria bacterium]|jgi:uncharacterized protein (DUF427 family)|nr:DUF427 domain-containing protein [Gammaproteobacteria bacterium]
MSAQPNPAPGFHKHPDYSITTERPNRSYRVDFNGETIADTHSPLLLQESRHRPVFYVAKDDVRMELLEATDHQTYCPFKGNARYWTIKVGEREAENAVWAYDDPYDELPEVEGFLAFYADRVDAIYIDGKLQEATGPGRTDR